VAHEPQELTVADAAAWRDWLRANHADAVGVWLVLARKGTTEPTTLTYAQALDEALCHGWIDGQARQGDQGTWRQRFTPRRARSPWSARNVGHVARLTAEGRMHPAGLAEVERARADGRWAAAYPGSGDSEVPEDLAAALAANPRAGAMFEVLTSRNRFAILHRLRGAKRSETRARRLVEFVAMLDRGETIYPQRAAPPASEAMRQRDLHRGRSGPVKSADLAPPASEAMRQRDLHRGRSGPVKSADLAPPASEAMRQRDLHRGRSGPVKSADLAPPASEAIRQRGLDE
jgi:uncharacterized protein YdeI (YjbR/CyaY-like superfamily)